MSLLLKPLNMGFPGSLDGGQGGGSGPGGFSPIDIGAGTNISPGFGESIGAFPGSIYGGFVPSGSNQGPGVASGAPGSFGISLDFPTTIGAGNPLLSAGGDSGGSSQPSTAGTIAKGVVSAVTGPVGMLFGFGILRLVLGIIGLICIAGAVYLYKPELITTQVNAAKGALVP